MDVVSKRKGALKLSFCFLFSQIIESKTKEIEKNARMVHPMHRNIQSEKGRCFQT